MEKKNKAAEYVQKNSEQILSLLEKIFQEGYDNGVKDSMHRINIDGIEYLDLGLPSGTLWSFPYFYCDYGWKLQRLSYDEVKEMGLPTQEQWSELCQHCRFDGRKIIAPNGVVFGYPSHGYRLVYTLGEQCVEGHNKFWLKGTPDDKHEVVVVEYDKGVNTYSTHFTGYRLPFFLVKNTKK